MNEIRFGDIIVEIGSGVFCIIRIQPYPFPRMHKSVAEYMPRRRTRHHISRVEDAPSIGDETLDENLEGLVPDSRRTKRIHGKFRESDGAQALL